MQVQQAHLADINSWQTCIYLSVWAVRTVVRAGVCQGPESKSGDAQGASGRLDLVLSVDVSLCLDLQVGLRVWISPGLLWKHSFFHPPPGAPSMPKILKMALPRPARATVPIPTLWRKGFPPAITPTPAPSGAFSGAFSGSKLESIVHAALVLAFIETDRLPP